MNRHTVCHKQALAMYDIEEMFASNFFNQKKVGCVKLY